MAPFKDTAVTPYVRALRNCAVQQLVAVGRPVCRFPLYWNGGHPPADACDCTCDGADGQGWARLVSLNAQTNHERWAPCMNGRFDITVELGLYRCSPVPEQGTGLVPEEVEEEHAFGMMLDAAALRAAVRCCDWLDRRDIVATINHQSAIGPSGGCVGVETQIRLTSEECGCPEQEDTA